MRQADDAARALGVQLQVLKAHTPSEIEAAFAAMSSQPLCARMSETVPPPEITEGEMGR